MFSIFEKFRFVEKVNEKKLSSRKKENLKNERKKESIKRRKGDEQKKTDIEDEELVQSLLKCFPSLKNSGSFYVSFSFFSFFEKSSFFKGNKMKKRKMFLFLY